MNVPATGPRPWFTTIATAGVWGAFFGAVPAAATIIVPFVALFIVPIAIGGAALGFATAVGASVFVAVSWRLTGTRPVAGYLVAALGGFCGCLFLIRCADAIQPSSAPPLAELGVALLAGIVAGTFLPSFSRRLAGETHAVVGIALLATLVATAASCVACALAVTASNLGGTSWSRDDEACRETSTYGALVGRVISYLPAQSTCVYENGSVETIPRSDLMAIALVAGVGLVAMALAWILFAGRHRSHVFMTQGAALIAAGATTLVLLALFGSSLYGALAPVATEVSP